MVSGETLGFLRQPNLRVLVARTRGPKRYERGKDA